MKLRLQKLWITSCESQIEKLSEKHLPQAVIAKIVLPRKM